MTKTQKQSEKRRRIIINNTDKDLATLAKLTGLKESYIKIKFKKILFGDKPPKERDVGTICWQCANKNCSWIKSLKPVPNWDAEKKLVSGQGIKYESYLVKSCPNFEESSDGMKFLKAIYKQIDILSIHKKVCKKLLVNQNVLNEICKVISFEDLREMLNAPIVVENKVKTYKVIGGTI